MLSVQTRSNNRYLRSEYEDVYPSGLTASISADDRYIDVKNSSCEILPLSMGQKYSVWGNEFGILPRAIENSESFELVLNALLKRLRPTPDETTVAVILNVGLDDFDYLGLYKAISEVKELAALPEDWDGYGAPRISTETAKNTVGALKVLLAKAPAPDIMPNPNGTLSLEWESLKGVADLEIGRTRFSFYIKPSVGVPILKDGLADNIDRDIGELIGSVLFSEQSS